MAWTKYGHKPKMIQVTCQCGCNEVFGAIVTSNRPKYKNKTHQMRAYRRRLREAKQKKNNRAGLDEVNPAAYKDSQHTTIRSVPQTPLRLGGRGDGFGQRGEGPVTPLPDYDPIWVRWNQQVRQPRNKLARMFVW